MGNGWASSTPVNNKLPAYRLPTAEEFEKMSSIEKLSKFLSLLLSDKGLLSTGSVSLCFLRDLINVFPWPTNFARLETTECYNNIIRCVNAIDRKGAELYVRQLCAFIGIELEMENERNREREKHRIASSSTFRAPTIQPLQPKSKILQPLKQPLTYINATGKPLTLLNGNIIEPVQETLDFQTDTIYVDTTPEGVSCLEWNITETVPNVEILQKYNAENAMLIINEKLAIWWFDVSEDIEWNGPVAFPVFNNMDTCEHFHIIRREKQPL